MREDAISRLSAAKRFERCAHLGDEKLRLFPRRKMGTLRELVVVDELGISLLSPTLRCLVNLFGEALTATGMMPLASKKPPVNCARCPSRSVLTRSRCSSASRA